MFTSLYLILLTALMTFDVNAEYRTRQVTWDSIYECLGIMDSLKKENDPAKDAENSIMPWDQKYICYRNPDLSDLFLCDFNERCVEEHLRMSFETEVPLRLDRKLKDLEVGERIKFVTDQYSSILDSLIFTKFILNARQPRYASQELSENNSCVYIVNSKAKDESLLTTTVTYFVKISVSVLQQNNYELREFIGPKSEWKKYSFFWVYDANNCNEHPVELVLCPQDAAVSALFPGIDFTLDTNGYFYGISLNRQYVIEHPTIISGTFTITFDEDMKTAKGTITQKPF